MTTFSNIAEFEQQVDSVDLDLGSGRLLTVRYSGAGNRAYRHFMSQFYIKHRRAIDNDTLPLDASDAAEREAFARHVVVGWRGFTNGAGEVPFTVQNCMALFEQAPALFEQVREEAQRLANFRQEDIADGEQALKKH